MFILYVHLQQVRHQQVFHHSIIVCLPEQGTVNNITSIYFFQSLIVQEEFISNFSAAYNRLYRALLTTSVTKSSLQVYLVIHCITSSNIEF